MEESKGNDFLVAEFPEEENSNGIIPMAILSSSWVYEKNGCLYCYWPSYLKSDKEKEKLIKNHEKLKEDKCMECAISIKFSTDSYEKATAKLARLEELSQTESESENEPYKRVPKKKYFSDFEPDFSDTEMEIPKVPQPKKLAALTPVTYIKRSFSNCQSTSQNQNQSYSQSISKNQSHSQGDSQTSSHIQSSSQSQSSSSKSMIICKGCQENKGLLVEVLRQLDNTKIDLKHLINLNSTKADLPTLYEPFQAIDSTEELLQFNSSLDNEEFFVKACSQFQLFGGKDAAEGTRKILANFITHQLSLTMNWSGRNNKVGFCSLKKILTLIHVCLRKNPLAQNATFTEIENTVKVWLRNASDREGGRAKRANKDSNNKESHD